MAANIPGIIGYLKPGAYTRVRSTVSGITLGRLQRREPAIIGLGQTERVLVTRANTETPTTFLLEKYPIVIGSINVFIQSSDGTLTQLTGTANEGGYQDDVSYGAGDEFYIDYLDADGTSVTDIDDGVAARLTLVEALSYGDSLIINYVAEEDILDPERFTSLEKLYEKHGYPSTTNTLALAAEMCFENGAHAVTAVQALPLVPQSPDRWYVTSREGIARLKNYLIPLTYEVRCPDGNWSGAYDALEAEDVQQIIPVPVASDGQSTSVSTDFLGPAGLTDETISKVRYFDVFTAGRNHVEKMSGIRERHERLMMFGSPTLDEINCEMPLARSSPGVQQTYTAQYQSWQTDPRFDDVTEFCIDDTYGIDNVFGHSFRCCFYMPDIVHRTISGTSYNISGMYIAAAAAGWFAGTERLALPLTFKTLSGFSITRDRKWRDSVLDDVAQAHVTIFEPITGGGRCRHSLTTINSEIAAEEEPTVVFIRDYVARTMRERLEDRYVGSVVDDATLADIYSTAQITLRAFAQGEILRRWQNLGIAEDELEPRQVNVTFDVMPVYPLNWIRIDFSIGVLS